MAGKEGGAAAGARAPSGGGTAMRYLSSRGDAPVVTFSEAVATGLAPDGGLYLPVRLPAVDPVGFAPAPSLPDVAQRALAGFVAGDRLQDRLCEIARAALDFPAPTTAVAGAADPLYALELFHGPTAAFKDFGARFLAECLERIEAPGASAGVAPLPGAARASGAASAPMTILVATSGDTGGAVAAAFHGRPWVRVVILYPKGLVSPRQEQQLTCWGDNVSSLRIDGTFDDCQRMVKDAFNDPGLRARHRLSSANSINVGRLLPQMVYYAASSLEVRSRTRSEPSYIIPAGNLGNAFAAMWARAMGFPIRRIVLAHNRNRTVPDFFRTGVWEPRASVATPASAMDVGNPSNMERVRALYPSIAEIREHLSADSVDDATIRARIGEDFMRYGREWCPHTATAAELYARLPSADRRAHSWVIVATAHPAKFNEIVEPIIGKKVSVPESLARLLALPQHFKDLPPTLGALAAALE